jgi:GNAT superfamily N-acetyltransferase
MPAGVLIVAEDEDRRLAGFADLDAQAGVVRGCYVEPDFARRGVGRALMDAVEREARSAGRSALLLDATRNAVPFYEALGWRAEAPARHPLGHGATLDCVIMSKAIARS